MSKAISVSKDTVDASPVKSFFVNMLTRDIKLEDAILDLLDNSVDGVLRSNKKLKGDKPYKGFYAEIDFDKDSFTISDNCGGIPWDLKDYAFRMGRSDDRPVESNSSVGVYGIGMKRAIFKMGRHCLLSTQNNEHRYEVEITPKWIEDENLWDIPVTPKKKDKKEDGTTLLVGKLYPGIAAQFGTNAKSFFASLEQMVSSHYAFIIDKGFTVKINGKLIKPLPTQLIFTTGAKGSAVKPYIWEAVIDGVEVFLTVGFTRPIPTQNEIDDEQEEKRYSTSEAGWTVVCNDRAVLYKDRSELTGWGEATVPQYHTQFIAIAGIVEFRSKDPNKLPTTTTKRGIDASSPLYLKVKNKMREGMLIFIQYTNRWKGQAEETKKHMAVGKPLSLDQIKGEAKNLKFNNTNKNSLSGRQYIPSLPIPKTLEPTTRRITFVKKTKDIELLAEYLFEDKDITPSTVGEECFDLMLKDAK